MGQYYVPLLKRADGESIYFNSHKFDNGLKLMEHSYFNNNFVNAVKSNLYNHRAKVVWMGDYGDGAYAEFSDRISEDEFMNYFRLAHDDSEAKDGENINVEVDFNVPFYALLNHDTKEYINYETYTNRADCNGWILDPLPLLTACGNGRGGGDFCNRDNAIGIKDVGKWAFCELEIVNMEKVPLHYNEVDYIFVEDKDELEDHSETGI